MVNRIYLACYVVIHSLAFLLSLAAANYGRYRQNPLFIVIISIGGLLFSLVPLFFARSISIRDFSFSASNLPRKLQILPQLYRFLLLFMIPFLLLTFLPRDYKTVFTMINFFALILVLQTVLFPLGTDDLSCRLMANAILLILAGYSSTPLTWFLSTAALVLMLSSITVFLLMHQYNRQQGNDARQLLRITLSHNIKVFAGAVILALLTTVFLFSVLPRHFIKDLPGNSVSLEMLIPKLFDTSFVGLIMYSIISLAVILLLFHMISKYLRPKTGKHSIMPGEECVIDAEHIKTYEQFDSSHHWVGSRKLIIDNYLKIRKQLKKYGFNLRDSMTPNEVATRMGGKIKDLKTDFERLTRLFHWARYSKSEPTDNEKEASIIFKESIKQKIIHFFKD